VLLPFCMPDPGVCCISFLQLIKQKVIDIKM